MLSCSILYVTTHICSTIRTHWSLLTSTQLPSNDCSVTVELERLNMFKCDHELHPANHAGDALATVATPSPQLQVDASEFFPTSKSMVVLGPGTPDLDRSCWESLEPVYKEAVVVSALSPALWLAATAYSHSTPQETIQAIAATSRSSLELGVKENETAATVVSSSLSLTHKRVGAS